jgi:hypothetical protein
VWQGRYYSCPLDDTHLWEALRYTGLWSCDDWRAYLQAQPESSRKAIRDSTFSGRPLAQQNFTRALERQEHRPLIRQTPGSKKRSEPGQQQAVFSFDPF